MPLHKSLEIWSAQTLADIGIIFSIFAFFLYIGRPYFERILSRLPLRVAADLWWIVYILLREGSLLLSFLIGFFTLNLDLMADIKIGLPFVPFGTVSLAAALFTKVFFNAEDLNKHYVRTTFWVTAAAFLNTIGYVLIMEAPGDEYAAAQNVFWQTLKSWRSNANPELSTITFYITFPLLLIITFAAVVKIFRTFSKSIQAEK